MNPRSNLIYTIAITLSSQLPDMPKEERMELAELILDDLRIDMCEFHGHLSVKEWSDLMEEE
jgi:hypothetical protein